MQHDPKERIYLDYNATTPVDPRVLEEMQPYFTHHFGNPASGLHAWGWTASTATEKARVQIASLIGAKPSEIFFTGGATEGNNTALFGLFHSLRAKDPTAKIHYLICEIEHSSVRSTGLALKKLGVDVEFIPVNRQGVVDIEQVRKAIRPETKLISVMWVNNEIGSINPVRELAALAQEKKVYFHSDAVQAVGKHRFSLKEIPIDLLTLSGHKIYGPKGAGVLFVRTGTEIDPLIFGGGQEQGFRSGTLNVPAIVGLGKAAEICMETIEQETADRSKLWKRLRDGLEKQIADLQINTPEQNFFSTLSLTFKNRPIDLYLPKLQKIGFSTGSACASGKTWISHVLKGIGLTDAEAGCTIRLSLGRSTTEAEVDRTIEIMAQAFAK